MRVRPLLNIILQDEALTRGLGDAEARILIEWLTDWAETFAARFPTETEAHARVEFLRRRGRAIRRFVELWCHTCDHAAAAQLAATERFAWPLPDVHADPWWLMHQIVSWEDGALHAA